MSKLVLRVGGANHEFVTLGELAKMSGKTTDSMKKLIKRGLIPDSNLRTPPKKITYGERIGELIEGDRIYSLNILVPVLVPLLKSITQGKRITIEHKVKIYDAFEMERIKLNI